MILYYQMTIYSIIITICCIFLCNKKSWCWGQNDPDIKLFFHIFKIPVNNRSAFCTICLALRIQKFSIRTPDDVIGNCPGHPFLCKSAYGITIRSDKKISFNRTLLSTVFCVAIHHNCQFFTADTSGRCNPQTRNQHDQTKRKT